MEKVDDLPIFAEAGCIAKERAEDALRSSRVKRVICCALGPKGNNIEQAATRWLERMGVADKSEVVLRDTPELCLELARSITEDGVVAVFWTCAVYARENEFFFGNPDVYPFFFQEEMPLDVMQLAARPELTDKMRGSISMGCLKVASHPSPAPLVKGLGSQIVLKNSNAAAARACAEGETELCITTESARKIYGLVQLHSFGSPVMVFFGGITRHGLTQIRRHI